MENSFFSSDLFVLSKPQKSLLPDGQNADTLSMETKTLETETALVAYLGVETYVATLAYLVELES